MINFYELYILFLKTNHNYYFETYFNLIAWFIILFIFGYMIFTEIIENFTFSLFLRNEIVKLFIVFFFIFIGLFPVFKEIWKEPKNAEKEIVKVKQKYNFKIEKEKFLAQGEKLKVFCENYNNKNKYIQLKDPEFCKTDEKDNVNEYTFNKVFSNIYKINVDSDNSDNSDNSNNSLNEAINFIK